MSKQELFCLGLDERDINPDELAAIPHLLGAAALAETAPRQSGFSVQAAAMNARGDLVHGGNREYALSGSYVHAEEAVVSKLLSEYPGVPLLGVGIRGTYEPDSLTMPCPCGNCRDVLRAEASPDLLLTAGTEGVAVVTRLSTFLFDTFYSADFEMALTNPLLAEGFAAARLACDRSVTAYLPERLHACVYGVALIDENQQIFPGSLDATASYDAIPPGVAAVQSFRNRLAGNSAELARLRAVVIVGASDSVDPLYRDRAAIKELDEVLKSNDIAAEPTQVLIFGIDKETREPVGLRRTDTAEWLPLPFTGSAFGQVNAAGAKRMQLARYL